MLTRLIAGLTVALTIASGMGALTQASAAPIGGDPPTALPAYCAIHSAAFTVQTTQLYTVFSPKILTVRGTCFTQGASLIVWDYAAGASLTSGWYAAPTDANGQFTYTVSNASCHDLLQVRVLDVAHNTIAAGNGKVYGPCQPPPPVFTE